MRGGDSAKAVGGEGADGGTIDEQISDVIAGSGSNAVAGAGAVAHAGAAGRRDRSIAASRGANGEGIDSKASGDAVRGGDSAKAVRGEGADGGTIDGDVCYMEM